MFGQSVVVNTKATMTTEAKFNFCSKIACSRVHVFCVIYLVLCVASGFQIWRTHADHIAWRNIREMSQDFPHPNHLADPFFVAFVLQTLLQRYRFGSHLVLFVCQRLNLLIVTVEQLSKSEFGVN